MEIQGIVVNPGIVSGRVVILPETIEMAELKKIDSVMNRGNILVAKNATPKLIVLYKKAGAMVVEQGGLLSHAVKISRELKIPCVIGVAKATEILQTGDLVEVDANEGTVRILDK
ncbi:MAG: hypothetical protein HYT46_00590 [Candidatus Vogelbacteria bacterium]|nr:hypothetical protein [Candidatus Vogelbacteria bacterium]